MKRYTLYLMGLFFLASCIERVEVPIRNVDPRLVVEGWITTDSVPYRVRVSESGAYTLGNSEPLFINNASVRISGSDGRSTPLVSVGEGHYETTDPDFIGEPGIGYRLQVTLADGRQFSSSEVRIPERTVTEFRVDTVLHDPFYSGFTPTSFDVRVRFRDQGPERNYYLLQGSAWIPRFAEGEPCGFSICNQFCYQFYRDSRLRVLEDRNVNGAEVRYQPGFRSPMYWYGRQYLDLECWQVNEEAYRFWSLFLQQQERTGSVLDPLPATLEGNIREEGNDGKRVLGYFGAATVTHHRAIIVPFIANDVQLLRTTENFISPGGCTKVYPGSSDQTPAGWDFAREHAVYPF